MAGESIFRFWRAGRRSTEEEASVREDNSAPVQEHEFNTGLGSAVLNVRTSRDNGVIPYTTNEIIEMAKNPARHIENLRQWSRWAYYTNGTVTTAVDSLTSLYALDYLVTAKPKREDVVRGGGRSGIDRMNGVLRAVRYKEVIRDAIFRDAVDGMYVGFLETRGVSAEQRIALTDMDIDDLTEINSVGMNVSVIALPVEHCRIIGRRNNCYEVAFDLRYFEGMTQEERGRKLRGFPKQIQDGWVRYEAGEFENGASWLRLDWHRTIVTKIKSGQNEPCGVPFVVAALDDIEYAKYFINTKRRVLDTVNNQIYYETFPEGKERGTSALTEKQQRQQHDTVKNALVHRNNSSGVSFFSLAAGTHMDRLPVDISLLDEENENAITEDVNEDLGFSAAALSGRSSGNYATATLNLEIVASNVFTWIEAIVEELNKCLNYTVLKNRDYRTEFHILPVTFFNRDKMVKHLSDLYARGKGSLLAWVAASGINADDYVSAMDYELNEDFENRYPVHKTSFTITGKDAPEYQDVDGSGLTNPSTASTAANNGNASPAPSDV